LGQKPTYLLGFFIENSRKFGILVPSGSTLPDKEGLMKLVLAVVIGIGMVFFMQVNAAAAPAVEPAGDNSAPLCQPGIYLEVTTDCLPLGPSSYLTEMARQGMVFPLQPLPARKPDPNLIYLPYSYAVLQDHGAAVYGSPDDAVAGSGALRTIAGGYGMKYISYIDTIDFDGNGKPDVFQLKDGGWIHQRDVSTRWGARPPFQGLLFSQTPLNDFGWINAMNAYIETRRTPGYGGELTGRQILQYTPVQIYSVAEADGMEWYLIGPDEWIEKRFVGRVYRTSTPPQGVTNGRWIEINLYEQTLAVYDNHEMVFATLMASGVENFWTRPGLFQIYQKLESTPMSGSFEADRTDFYYLEDVPWTMYYDEARAVHGAYWRTRLGFPQSHGCVNLTPGDAQWLFNWAQEGDWVYVWDPSGNTPEDPSLYSSGGA
jgi:hypothetical protein